MAAYCWSSADILRWRANGPSPAACWNWEKPSAKPRSARLRKKPASRSRPPNLLGVYDRVLRDDEGRTLYHFVLIDFLCRRVSGQAQAAGDADRSTLVHAGRNRRTEISRGHRGSNPPGIRKTQAVKWSRGTLLTANPLPFAVTRLSPLPGSHQTRQSLTNVAGVPADPRQILHGLKAVQDDAIMELRERCWETDADAANESLPFHKPYVILNPGFSRVKDLARIATPLRFRCDRIPDSASRYNLRPLGVPCLSLQAHAWGLTKLSRRQEPAVWAKSTARATPG